MSHRKDVTNDGYFFAYIFLFKWDWTFGVDVSATIIFNKLLQFIKLFQCFDVSALNMIRVIIVILNTYLSLKLYSLLELLVNLFLYLCE